MKFRLNKLTFLLATCVYGVSFSQAESVPAAAAAPAQAASGTTATPAHTAATGNKLEATVVTATRTARMTDETPGATYVVTQDQMQSRNLKTLDEAVNNIPGVFSTRSKGMMDTSAAISLRGMPNSASASRTLVMIDGMPINSGYTGGVNFAGINGSDFSRVEVALGAAASLYGNSAMGGVVNYVSQMPQEREFTYKLGYGSSLDSETAMQNLKRVYVSYGDKLANVLSLFASFSGADTDGYRTTLAQMKTRPAGTVGGYASTTVTGAPQYVVGEAGTNQWREGSVTLRAALDLPNNGQWRLGFSRNQYENEYGAPITYLRNASTGAEVFPNSTSGNFPAGSSYHYNYLGPGKSVTDLFQSSLETAAGPGRLRANVGLLRSHTNWYVNPPRGGNPLNEYLNGAAGSMSSRPNRTIYGDVQYTFSPLDKHVVVAGASIRNEKVDISNYSLSDWRNIDSKISNTEFRGGKTRSIGLFIQDEIAVTDAFTVTAGLRWDTWKTSGGYYDLDGAGITKPMVRLPSYSQSAISPKLGLHYRVNDAVSLRSSVGKAFRTPTPFELYGSFSGTTPPYVFNPDLKPETAITWDIGADLRPWAWAELKPTLYLNQLRDMIYTRTYATEKRRENLGRARGYGLEIDFRQKIGSNWTLLASAALNRTRIQENITAPTTVGNQFADVPKTTANLGLEWNSGPWSASGWLHHASKRFGSEKNDDVVNEVMGSRDPYTIVNLKGAYRINKNLKVSLAVDNAFNRKYFSGVYRAPSRSYFLEVAGAF